MLQMFSSYVRTYMKGYFIPIKFCDMGCWSWPLENVNNCNILNIAQLTYSAILSTDGSRGLFTADHLNQEASLVEGLGTMTSL